MTTNGRQPSGKLEISDPRSSSDSSDEASESDSLNRSNVPWQNPQRSHSSYIQLLRHPVVQWLQGALVVILALVSVVLLSRQSTLKSQIRQLQRTDNVASPSLAQALRSIYGPLIPVDALEFKTENATFYAHAADGKLAWPKPLKSEVLILDIDSRPLDSRNQLLHNGPVSWPDFDGFSSGMLAHYSYALLHGYDYKFIRIGDLPDRFPSWWKPRILSSLLSTNSHRFVLLADNDAIFHHPQLPLEFLLNHWGITPRTSLAMPLDPGESGYNVDRFNRTMLNTGFIISQNLPRTREILDAWATCPDSGEFPGCEWWKNLYVYEQRAFSEYLRYKYDREDDIKALPCDEANGHPESESECSGQLIRHYWVRKHLLRGGVEEVVMNGAMQSLRDAFMGNVGELVVEWEGFNRSALDRVEAKDGV